MMYDVGRMCLKIAGREAGRYCVIVKKIDEKFVMVTGPRDVTQVKRRRCNINHLEPLSEVIKIKSDASDEDVVKAFDTGSIYTKLNIEKPSRAKPKEEKPAKAEDKKTKRKEETPKKEKKSEKKPKAKKPAPKKKPAAKIKKKK